MDIAGTFCAADWNLYKAEGPQTSNHSEGWHNCLWWVVDKSNPNIFECVEVFKKEQVSTEVSIQQLAAAECPPHQRKKAIEKDQHIKELKERFSGMNSLIITSLTLNCSLFNHHLP